MSYETRNPSGIEPVGIGVTPAPAMMCTGMITEDDVYNLKGEDLGDIREIIVDTRSGRVAYALLSFGSFLGMGGKLFVVPWSALKLDADNTRFVLDVEKERLENAPGFDKDDWPDMADQKWASEIHTYYGATPYSDQPSL